MSKNRLYFIGRLLIVFAFVILSAANLVFAQSDRLKVFVSILPQKYFVEKLLGKNCEVEVLIGPGQSPHTYEPLPQQMGKLSRADIYFTVGIPFEVALKNKIANLCPNLKIADSDAGIEKRIMSEEHSHSHEEMEHHHEGHHHCKGEKDPHFWLDPEKAYLMSENMAKVVAEIKPELKNKLETNLEQLKSQMAVLVKELSEVLAPYKGKTMLVFHPAFGYFSDKFGMIQKSVEIEGKEPAPKQLARLIKTCKEQGVKILFVQKQFPTTTAKTIADSIGGKVIAIDPLAEDYIENLKVMANSIAGSAN